MIVLIGESASGKTTLEKELSKRGYDRIVSYTTRPIRERDNEVDGVDYHFISEKQFLSLMRTGFFAECTNYNDWYYGIAKEDCLDNSVVVVEPYGFRQLQKLEGLNIQSFYIKTSWQTRLKRMIDRGDNLMEMFRRVVSDMGVFQGIDNEVSHVVDNDFYGDSNSINRALEQILTLIK